MNLLYQSETEKEERERGKEREGEGESGGTIVLLTILDNSRSSSYH